MSGNHILDYWEAQGAHHGSSHWASWGDNWMIELEIETIGSRISVGDRVLDVGCANGYSTFRQFRDRKPAAVIGLDFAANMIEVAKQEKERSKLGDEITFE